MHSANRRPQLFTESIALPPTAIDFAVPSTVPQAIAKIKTVGSQMKLNRCQFKRIEAMCLSLGYGGRTQVQRSLLLDVHARCATWQQASLLQSLVSVPEDMDRYETRCTKLGAKAPDVTKCDLKAENEAIASTIEQLVSNEQGRTQAMALRGPPAELFVSHLQTALDTSINNDPNLREECIKALRKLCNDAEVLPLCMKIEEVTFDSADAEAQGGFSDVFKGRWKHHVVAVKRPRIFKEDPEKIKQARREILLWRQLSNEHVLPLLGIFHENRFYSMVSKWMPNGTLKSFLENPANQKSNRLHLIYQIAKGLEYLHSHKPVVAHGDLKAANVFVDSDLRPLIGDFGLSCNHYNIDRTMSSTIDGGSVRWMSPELLLPEKSGTGRYKKPTLESDMWAFSMLMLEIFTDAEPYDTEPVHIFITNITEKKILPARPGRHITERGLTDDVWDLMKECWKYNPSDRPNISYVVRNLQRLSRDVRPTAWELRTENELVPTTLVGRAITSDEANWKILDVKVVQRGNIPKNRMTAISETRNQWKKPVFESQRRLKKIGGSTVTAKIHIPKQLHSRIIGKKGCHVKRLEKKHLVRIEFPKRDSAKTQVELTGNSTQVEAAKLDLDKMVKFEQNSRDVIRVPRRAAEIISGRWLELLRPLLREINVDVEAGTVTLRGKREGIIFAQTSIQKIEDEIASEVTEEILIDSFHYDMLKSDPRTWEDIVERCGYPRRSNAKAQQGLLNISPNKLQVRGPHDFVKLVHTEIEELMAVGHACIQAKRISASRHESLLSPHSELIKDMRRETKAMVYFPGSGGYLAVGTLEDMNYYNNLAPEDIVKLVGTPNACEKAQKYLKKLVEEQREKERNPVYVFPVGMQDLVKRRLEPRFRTWGISVEPSTPNTAGSILSFVSDDRESITATGACWSIHERRDIADLPKCEWRLVAKSADALTKGGEFLQSEVKVAYRRIGVVKIQVLSHLSILKSKLPVLKDQDEDISFEIVDKPCQVVIAGSSTDKVESTIHKVIALFESSGD